MKLFEATFKGISLGGNCCVLAETEEQARTMIEDAMVANGLERGKDLILEKVAQTKPQIFAFNNGDY